MYQPSIPALTYPSVRAYPRLAMSVPLLSCSDSDPGPAAAVLEYVHLPGPSEAQRGRAGPSSILGAWEPGHLGNWDWSDGRVWPSVGRRERAKQNSQLGKPKGPCVHADVQQHKVRYETSE